MVVELPVAGKYHSKNQTHLYNQFIKDNMKKSTIILLGIGAIILISVAWYVSAYNGLVNKDEAVKASWSEVQNQYQRRSDLIPNLVATVKGYATHESSTLEGVVAARAKATQVNIDADHLTPENIKAYQSAQGELSSALGRLLMVTENYPDLKANENFKELQAQLEGTENRITVARKSFIDESNQFNASIRQFPLNIVASMGGFEKKAYFEAEAGSEKAPKVQF